MSNTFAFTTDELNVILKGLQKLPFEESAVLITRIMNEFNAQQGMTATAEAIQKAASDPANIVDAPPGNRKQRRAASKRK